MIITHDDRDADDAEGSDADLDDRDGDDAESDDDNDHLPERRTIRGPPESPVHVVSRPVG